VICPTAQGKGLRHFNATGKSRELRKLLSSEEQLLELIVKDARREKVRAKRYVLLSRVGRVTK
jgi:hypothetical protein